MAERKLNFDAPLLSVRRIASRPMSPNRENTRFTQNSPQRRQQQTAPDPRPAEQDFGSELVTDPVAVPFQWERIPGWAKAGKVREDSVPVPPKKLFEFPKQKPNWDGGSKQIKISSQPREDDDDVYSDALDALSSNESASLNCSASGLSGSDSAGPSGSFSTDPQTRDYMMKRFLPAAKAMALEPPRSYAVKKPTQTAEMYEHARQVKRMIGDEKKPDAVMYREGEAEEESEGDEDSEIPEYRAPKIISASGCGMFPRLCFRDSLSILGPISGMKVSSPKPTKPAQNLSLAKSVKKVWENYKKKSDSGYCSDGPKVAVNKRGDDSRRFRFSGELKGRLSPFRNSVPADPAPVPIPKLTKQTRSKSGELHMVGNRESRRFTYSGELYRGRVSPFRNTPVADGKPTGDFRGLTTTQSFDPQRAAATSPFGNSRASSISPYRNQSNQSPFRRAAFLGVPKVVKVDPSIAINRPRTEEALPSPAVVKTLYVDTVDNAKITSRPRLDYLGTKAQVKSPSKSTGTKEFSFPDTQCVKKELSGQETSEHKAADIKDSPVSLPLPRSPSESWLWRTIPTISLRNSFGSKEPTKKLNSKTSSTSSAKWETIVKTSKLNHDHARYSEELVAHISMQSKT